MTLKVALSNAIMKDGTSVRLGVISKQRLGSQQPVDLS